MGPMTQHQQTRPLSVKPGRRRRNTGHIPYRGRSLSAHVSSVPESVLAVSLEVFVGMGLWRFLVLLALTVALQVCRNS